MEVEIHREEMRNSDLGMWLKIGELPDILGDKKNCHVLQNDLIRKRQLM